MRRWTLSDLNKGLRKMKEQAVRVHLEKNLLGRVDIKRKGHEEMKDEMKRQKHAWQVWETASSLSEQEQKCNGRWGQRVQEYVCMWKFYRFLQVIKKTGFYLEWNEKPTVRLWREEWHDLTSVLTVSHWLPYLRMVCRGAQSQPWRPVKKLCKNTMRNKLLLELGEEK